MIDSNTKIVGIIGDPISHSLSPIMHNAAFKSLLLNWRYLAFRVDESAVEGALSGMRALGICGLNVTMPHKETVTDFLDELTEDVRLIRTVNTIENRGGRLVGHNTDSSGFVKAVREKSPLSEISSALIFGAGGSAKAVCLALTKMGLKTLVIVNRNRQRALALKELIESNFGTEVEVVKIDGDFSHAVREAQIVINATPAEPLINFELLQDGQIACDLVYYGNKSNFLQEAERRGLIIVDGLTFLLCQGADSFKIWTGIDAPIEVMRDSLQGRK